MSRIRTGGCRWPALVGWLLLVATTAQGADGRGSPSSAPGSWWIAAGPSAGSLSLDTDLADYRWDVTPAAVWGAQAIAGRSGLAFGLRSWRTNTTQGTGLQGETRDPVVHLTSLEAVGQLRLARFLGSELWGGVQAGLLRVAYEPDSFTFEAGGGAGPVTVNYKDIDAWNLGLGLEWRRPLARRLTLAVQVERSSFALDTSHRRGDEIVDERDRFANWAARLQMAWLWSLP